MRQETATLIENRSEQTTIGQLVLSAPRVSTTSVNLVVGRIGFPSVERELNVGGAMLFETPDDGLLELRVTRFGKTAVVRHRGIPESMEIVNEATVLISQVAPRGGITAGFTKQDVSNTPFEPREIDCLKRNLQEVREAAAKRADLTPEQVDFVSRKLDEMAQAASRVGRKDWVNLAIGTLTNVVVTAAINSEAARYLFQTAGNALSWLFGGPLKLLP